MISKLFNVWKYALGSYSDEKTKPYDNYITIIRSIIFISYLTTNCFIVAGVIKHWNNNNGQSCNQRAFKEAQTNQERFEETWYAYEKER
tara:strand:- start:360 stop:626 length:267 start_codon:yes stop_codon:yes gene_type:complete